MKRRKLTVNQVHDPAKGDFFVNPQVADKRRQEYIGSCYREKEGNKTVHTPHPEAVKFTLV